MKKLCVILIASLSLVACGSGGGSGNNGAESISLKTISVKIADNDYSERLMIPLLSSPKQDKTNGSEYFCYTISQSKYLLYSNASCNPSITDQRFSALNIDGNLDNLADLPISAAADSRGNVLISVLAHDVSKSNYLIRCNIDSKLCNNIHNIPVNYNANYKQQLANDNTGSLYLVGKNDKNQNIVYVSFDGGASWESISDKLENYPEFHGVSKILLNSSTNQIIAAVPEHELMSFNQNDVVWQLYASSVGLSSVVDSTSISGFSSFGTLYSNVGANGIVFVIQSGVTVFDDFKYPTDTDHRVGDEVKDVSFDMQNNIYVLYDSGKLFVGKSTR